MIRIITMLIVLAGTLGFYSCGNKQANASTDQNPSLSRQEAEHVVKQLIDLGYYKYADPMDVDSLKEYLIAALRKGILSTLYFDKPLIPKDFRYYMFDGESIFEQGGFTDMLKDMKGSFDKMGLKLEITNHIEEVDAVTKGLHHELALNGKRYVIFKNFKDYGWGEAAQKFAEMINDQLQLQNIDEQLYLINGGNDGAAVFLTEQQFQLIDKTLTDDQWKPLKLDKWCKVFGVKVLKND